MKELKKKEKKSFKVETELVFLIDILFLSIFGVVQNRSLII